MHQNQGPVYYGDYLKLPELLDLQKPLSRKHQSLENPECHDETLFIIVHQVYELWFKELIHDFKAVHQIMSRPHVDESELGHVNHLLERVIKIQRLMIPHLEIMETMTPMDFLEFRNLLIPASGFQSVQFREIEILLGLSTNDRENVDREFFMGRLSLEDRQKLTAIEKGKSLLAVTDEWLSRMPFSSYQEFSFWPLYKKQVEEMLARDHSLISSHANNQTELENLRLTSLNFKSILDENEHLQLKEKGLRKFSHKAYQNALFIMLYRKESLMQQPFNFLRLLMDIDENFTEWRYRHALMARRMLGTKIGTGGSSGHQYLTRTAETNRVFNDLFNLSTFLLPLSDLPKLPNELKNKLNFYV